MFCLFARLKKSVSSSTLYLSVIEIDFERRRSDTQVLGNRNVLRPMISNRFAPPEAVIPEPIALSGAVIDGVPVVVRFRGRPLWVWNMGASCQSLVRNPSQPFCFHGDVITASKTNRLG